MGSVETELTSGATTGGLLAALGRGAGPDRVVVDPAVTVACSRDMMPLA